MPSEKKREGYGTACGRGVYTTDSFNVAVQHAVPHLLGPESGWMDIGFVRTILPVAIPGHHAPLQGLWVYDETKKPGQRYSIVPVQGSEDAVRKTQEPGQLAKDVQGTPGWTIWNKKELHEETSSIAYVVGVFVLACDDGSLFSKKTTRGSQDAARGFLGWDVGLEPPFARPQPQDNQEAELHRNRSRNGSRSRSRSCRRSINSDSGGSHNRQRKGVGKGKGRDKGKGKGRTKG